MRQYLDLSDACLILEGEYIYLSSESYSSDMYPIRIHLKKEKITIYINAPNFDVTITKDADIEDIFYILLREMIFKERLHKNILSTYINTPYKFSIERKYNDELEY